MYIYDFCGEYFLRENPVWRVCGILRDFSANILGLWKNKNCRVVLENSFFKKRLERKSNREKNSVPSWKMRCLFSRLPLILTCRTVDLFSWSRSIHKLQSENGKYNLQSNADVYKQFLLHRIITTTNLRLLIIKQVGKEKYIPSVTCRWRIMLKAAPDFLSHDLGSIHTELSALKWIKK